MIKFENTENLTGVSLIGSKVIWDGRLKWKYIKEKYL